MPVRARLFCSVDDGPEIMTGRVKWFSTEKGYGFILPDDETMSDVFVHHTGICAKGYRRLFDDQEVEFQLINDDNGRLKAVEVTGPDGAEITTTDRPEFRSDDGYY